MPMDRDLLTQSRKSVVRKINGLRLDRIGEWRRFGRKTTGTPEERDAHRVMGGDDGNGDSARDALKT
jgi:hypothetical protein